MHVFEIQCFANHGKDLPRLHRSSELARKLGPGKLLQTLRRAAYTATGEPAESSLGTYRLRAGSLRSCPTGLLSQPREGASFHFSGGEIEKITTLAETAKDDLDRMNWNRNSSPACTSRRNVRNAGLVSYDDVPGNCERQSLRLRTPLLRSWRGELSPAGQGSDDGHSYRTKTSTVAVVQTLTMQLAKGFFLTPDRLLNAKLAQI